ncbi:MAG: hypothetical protein ACTSVV_08990 [Promethearchaeota archaeon]
MTTVQNQILNILKSISNYLWKNTKENGDLYCKRHGIHHTGKNAYAMIMDLHLYEKTNNQVHFKRALKRLDSIIYRNFGFEKGYEYPHFFPGTINMRANISNVIEGGSTIDGLCFLLKYRDRLSVDKIARIERLIKLEISKYLANDIENGKIITSIIPNQRIWGATGVAASFKVSLGEESWKPIITKSMDILVKEQLDDGSFNYAPFDEKGLNDLSPLYHSRHAAFLWYCAKILEVENSYRESFLKAADALIATILPSGQKADFLEPKRWYWDTMYENGSYPFDLYVLANAYKETKNQKYKYYALTIINYLNNHLTKDEGINEIKIIHGMNFKCKIFTNAHFAWLVHCYDELSELSELNLIDLIEPELQFLPNSNFLKFKNEHYSTIIRGKKQKFNECWGPIIGGGSICSINVKVKQKWTNNLIKISDIKPNINHGYSISRRFSGKNFYYKIFKNENNFIDSLRKRIFLGVFGFSPFSFKSKIKYLLFHLYKHFIELFVDNYSTAFHPSSKLIKITSNKFKIKGVRISKNNGKGLPGFIVNREYTFEPDRMIIGDSILISNKKIVNFIYNLPITNLNNLKVINRNQSKIHLLLDHLEIIFILKNKNFKTCPFISKDLFQIFFNRENIERKDHIKIQLIIKFNQK